MPKTVSFTFTYLSVQRLLVSITNIGSYENPDLKFCCSHGIGMATGEKGFNYEYSKDNFVVSNIELTYHPDGSFLRKIPSMPINEFKYYNPNGKGCRIRPLNDIKDYEPIAIIDIQNYQICEKYVSKKNDSLLINLEEELLFNGEPFAVILYLKNKLFIVNKLSCELFYSDYMDISSNLDIGLFIQRIKAKKSQRVYSHSLKKYINTTTCNTICPCNEEVKKLIVLPDYVIDKKINEETKSMIKVNLK